MVAALAAPARFLDVDPRVLGAILVVAAAVAFVVPVVVVVAVPLVLGARAVRRRRMVERERSARIEAVYPDVVDLLVLAVSAGLTPREALVLVGPRLPEPFSSAVTILVGRVRAGEPFVRALEVLVAELGDPVRPLVATLAAAEHDGAPVGPGLQRAADEARRRRRVRAEEEARRIPVRMLFPLVACVLPAFVLLTLVPLLYGSLRQLSPG